MTRTLPLRTMIRHFSHLFLTDGLTCIRLLQLPRRTRFVFNYSSALGVVLTEFDRDFIAFQDASDCVAYRKRHVTQHVALILDSHPKERPWQHFYHNCRELSTFFFVATHFCVKFPNLFP